MPKLNATQKLIQNIQRMEAMGVHLVHEGVLYWQVDASNVECDLLDSAVPPKKLRLLDGVTRISTVAFAYRSEIEEVYMPNTVTVVHTRAFAHCRNLHRVHISNSIHNLGEGVFTNCISLFTLDMRDCPLIYIPTNTCRLCCNLREVWLPRNTQSIEASAFMGCNRSLRIHCPFAVQIPPNIMNNIIREQYE